MRFGSSEEEETRARGNMGGDEEKRGCLEAVRVRGGAG